MYIHISSTFRIAFQKGVLSRFLIHHAHSKAGSPSFLMEAGIPKHQNCIGGTGIAFLRELAVCWLLRLGNGQLLGVMLYTQ
jgi:hypothetical protein